VRGRGPAVQQCSSGWVATFWNSSSRLPERAAGPIALVRWVVVVVVMVVADEDATIIKRGAMLLLQATRDFKAGRQTSRQVLSECVCVSACVCECMRVGVGVAS